MESSGLEWRMRRLKPKPSWCKAKDCVLTVSDLGCGLGLYPGHDLVVGTGVRSAFGRKEHWGERESGQWQGGETGCYVVSSAPGTRP